MLTMTNPISLRWRKALKSLGLFIFLTSLSGCAFKKLIYNNLDWVAMYQIDSYLDLDKEQELAFKPVLADAIAWLKKEKIAPAIVIIQKGEAAAAAHNYGKGLSALFTDEVDTIRKDLVTRYEKDIVKLLVSLKPEQVEYLQKKLKKSNDNLEDVLDEKDAPKEYEEVILQKQKKNLVEWYGELSKEQSEQYFKAMRLTRGQIIERLKQRSRIQDFIIDTLRTKNPAKIAILVENFRDSGEVWKDEGYVKYRQDAEGRWEPFLQEFHKSLSDKQWKHLEGKLREMRVELEHLVK